jgi:hypothetical protein
MKKGLQGADHAKRKNNQLYDSQNIRYRIHCSEPSYSGSWQETYVYNGVAPWF